MQLEPEVGGLNMVTMPLALPKATTFRIMHLDTQMFVQGSWDTEAQALDAQTTIAGVPGYYDMETYESFESRFRVVPVLEIVNPKLAEEDEID